MELNRKLKMGMIGGGPGAFIGEVHRKATRMDGQIELVAGAFDINPRKSRQTCREFNITISIRHNLDDAFILVVLYVGISFAGLIRSNSDDMSILGCEMMCETGPDFSKPIDNHIAILENYTKFKKHKNKYITILLKPSSDHKPEEVLETVSQTLISDISNQENIAHLFDGFKVFVEKCGKGKIDAAKGIKDPDDPRKEFLEVITESERPRVRILQAMEVNYICRRSSQIWQAIEKKCTMGFITAEMYLSLCFIRIEQFLCCLFNPNGYNIVTCLRKIGLERNRFLKNLVVCTRNCSVERNGYEN